MTIAHSHPPPTLSITKVAEAVYKLKFSTIHFKLDNLFNINWASQVTASRTHIVRIGSEFAFDTTALLVFPDPKLEALDGISPDTSSSYCTLHAPKSKRRSSQ